MISCKCVAKIKLLPFLCKFCIPATKILTAEILSVPEHNSSPNTKLLSSANRKIVLSSDISTAKVERPLKILSFPKIRVKIYL